MNTINTTHYSETAVIGEYREYLTKVMTIQSEAVRRLAEDDDLPPMELAAMLEDLANSFLDLSDELRDFALGRSRTQAVI